MKVQILGIMHVNMEDEQGRPINGLSCHCCDADGISDGNFEGRHVAKVFIPNRILGDINLMVNQVVELHYSQTLGSKNARLSGIQIIK